LLVGLLGGCVPVLTGAKVDGLAAYTRLSGQLQESEKVMKENKFDRAPEWIFVFAKAKAAVEVLKIALTQNTDKTLVPAIKEATNGAALVNMGRLRAIAQLTDFRKLVKNRTDELLTVNVPTTDFVASAVMLLVQLDKLSISVKTSSAEELEKTLKTTYQSLQKFDQAYYSIVRQLRVVNPCYNIRCWEDQTCHVIDAKPGEARWRCELNDATSK